jgi:hypothetical protein
MDELNTMDGKVDQLLVDMGAVQNQLANIERQITGLEKWIEGEAALGTHVSDAETWIAQYFSNQANPGKSYNWALWLLAGCDPAADTCGGTVTDATIQAFNEDYYTASAAIPPKDPPTLATDNFYLWWAYNVNQQATVTPYTVNGNTADTIIKQLHLGMVPEKPTDTNGLLAYMGYVFSSSACATDVTAGGCDLYSQVYLPVEAYFQEVITNQITLVQAMVESYAELASFYETNHASNAYDTYVSVYMSDFQKMLSEEAESFVEVAEQIALYRAADGRFDWSSFNTSDAAQLLSRADFLAAMLVNSPTGKPWPWPPGVTGRIFYTEQPKGVPGSTTVHSACQGTSCTTLTEIVPMPQDLACYADSNYPGQCLLYSDWPYLQWSAPDGSNVVTGTPTFTWKIRRLTPRQMAEGTYKVASINAPYGNADLVVSQYGDDYSYPPAQGTTPVLFGSFNEVEGSLGIGALGANRTYSGGGDDALHNYGITPSSTYTEMYLLYEVAPTQIKSNWYEKMKVKVNAVPGTFPRVRLFWPNTVEIVLGEQHISGGNCPYHYYVQLEQSLQLLNSSGTAVTNGGQTLHPCGTGSYGFGSCNFSSTNRNGNTLLLTSPLTLDSSQTYTLQAHFLDSIYGSYYYGSMAAPCTQAPTLPSYVIWDVFNPTFVLVQ